MNQPAGVGQLPAALVQLKPDPWTMPFWAAASEHSLVCARCASCGRHRMPPSPFCPLCRSQEIDWDELPGTGVIFSFTVVRHAVVPVVKDHVPYVIAVVDLDGAPGARLVANVVDADPSDVAIGLPVRVRWHDWGDGVSVAKVVLVESATP